MDFQSAMETFAEAWVVASAKGTFTYPPMNGFKVSGVSLQFESQRFLCRIIYTIKHNHSVNRIKHVTALSKRFSYRAYYYIRQNTTTITYFIIYR